MGRGENFWLVDGVPSISQRLRIIARDFGDIDLPCPDPIDGETVGIKFDLPELLRHPLMLNPIF